MLSALHQPTKKELLEGLKEVRFLLAQEEHWYAWEVVELARKYIENEEHD